MGADLNGARHTLPEPGGFDESDSALPAALPDGGPARFPTAEYGYFDASPLELDEQGDYAAIRMPY